MVFWDVYQARYIYPQFYLPSFMVLL